jgi:hypothetical protein
MRLMSRRRDPDWGLEGRGARRSRRLRQLLESLIMISIIVVLLALFRPQEHIGMLGYLARLGDLLSGPAPGVVLVGPIAR